MVCILYKKDLITYKHTHTVFNQTALINEEFDIHFYKSDLELSVARQRSAWNTKPYNGAGLLNLFGGKRVFRCRYDVSNTPGHLLRLALLRSPFA